MESRIDEFRNFVKKYPLIKEDVKNITRKAQNKAFVNGGAL